MGMKFREKLKWCKSNGLLALLLFFAFCFCVTCVDTIVMHPHIRSFCDVRVPRYLVRCVIYALLLSAPVITFGRGGGQMVYSTVLLLSVRLVYYHDGCPPEV